MPSKIKPPRIRLSKVPVGQRAYGRKVAVAHVPGCSERKPNAQPKCLATDLRKYVASFDDVLPVLWTFWSHRMDSMGIKPQVRRLTKVDFPGEDKERWKSF